MAESVHDNWLYGLAINHERRRVVLHTVYPHADPPEYTDVVFDGVTAFHLEQQSFGGGPSPANVLFDVEEADPQFVLGQYADLLARTRNYGWPAPHYDGLDDLAARLTTGKARCFEVRGSWGACGFVFAASMELRDRGARAEAPGAEAPNPLAERLASVAADLVSYRKFEPFLRALFAAPAGSWQAVAACCASLPEWPGHAAELFAAHGGQFVACHLPWPEAGREGDACVLFAHTGELWSAVAQYNRSLLERR